MELKDCTQAQKLDMQFYSFSYNARSKLATCVTDARKVTLFGPQTTTLEAGLLRSVAAQGGEASLLDNRQRTTYRIMSYVKHIDEFSFDSLPSFRPEELLLNRSRMLIYFTRYIRELKIYVCSDNRQYIWNPMLPQLVVAPLKWKSTLRQSSTAAHRH